MKGFFLFALFALISACSDSGDDAGSAASNATHADYVPPPSTSYAQAHAEALAAIEQSVALGHAWSTAEALLAQAVTAAAEGNEALAIELADKARAQADLGAQQAAFEEQVWMERVLSN